MMTQSDERLHGFSVTRILPAGPSKVFSYFTDEEKFARWFVVSGYLTPAARLSLDAQPGGLIEGVMVSESDGSEIPFELRYGTIDPPTTVEFRFPDSAENVTMALVDLNEGRTQLTYQNEGLPPETRAEAVAGVGVMLDALESALSESRRHAFERSEVMASDNIRESIENAKQYLSEHPDEARYTDQPATAVIEDGLRCRVEYADGAVVVTDMPTGVGGENSAPSPGWLARAALASCDATLIAMRAAELSIPLQSLEVTVDSESDDRGLLGMDDAVPAGPLSSRILVRIVAEGVDPQRLRDLVEWADRHSPVSDAVRRAVSTAVVVESE
jgi:uncharacterized protein YndB with AHSA1/START domain/uncharacterized OsmC-like protein